ncbi:ribonuclease PH [Limnoglobus roseus]|uniref:Ribonuclease PH n=1 Tax=Limnoglobus roseus TaxID=2598579 RepID=A0A5C1ANQ2_9BACT|nr:ribonuclease PH [Limnoglobus roseus]QEL18488.1 ribonuclease PH [Limnoglobus roseus]
MERPHGRKPNQLRPLTFKRKYTRNAPGSVLVKAGNTVVLCTCTIANNVPDFLVGKGQGWMTAEYGMLPGSTNSRKARDKAGKIDGRGVEIQRLIGRSLRAVVNLAKLGERTIWIDCDVLDADGGTRTASITGAFVAVVDALQSIRTALPAPLDEILTDSVAAISVGIVEGEERLDLEYVEDRDAEVDLNLVMTGRGTFVEVQGTGEESTYTRKQLDRLVDLGTAGIAEITALQKAALGKQWPFKPVK